MNAPLLTKFSPPPSSSSVFHPQLSQLYYYGMRVVSECRRPDKHTESHSSSHPRSSPRTHVSVVCCVDVPTDVLFSCPYLPLRTHICRGEQWPGQVRDNMTKEFGGMPKDAHTINDYDPKV
jgi:hypothetical protein